MKRAIGGLIVAALACPLWTAPAPAEADMAYLARISGVQGDVNQPGWEGWIQATGVSYRVPGLPGPMALLGKPLAQGRGSLEGEVLAGSYFEITKELDTSSVWINDAAGSARIIPSVTLALCQPGQRPFFKYELKNVRVTGVEAQGSGERLRLNFEKIEFKDFRVAAHGSDMPVWGR